jgi:putative peptidoglycan lipid II flippase
MNLLRSASVVSLWTLASRVTGLGRDLLIAATFGASALTDAFNVAFRIPNLLRRLFAEGAFSQAFVPLLARHRAAEGDASTKHLVDAVATVLAWALVITSVAGVLMAPALVWAMASGLQKTGGFDAAVVMTRWMFPYIACASLMALAAGVLNTYKRFAVPAATPVLLNLSIIAAAWLLAPALAARGIPAIYSLAFGVMIGGVLQLAVQVPALARLGLLPRVGATPARLREAWQHPGVKLVLRQMAPALLGVSVAQISLLINTQIASHLAVGSVTWLGYADRLMEFPTALLGVALGVVLLPQLAAAQGASDPERYSALLDWGLRLVLLLALPSAVALVLFAAPLVSALFHYGAFTARDLQQTSLALVGYGVGLLGIVAVKVLAPAYYAQLDIRTPVKIAVVVLVVTQLINLVAVPQFAHAGLALSISLGALLNAGWLLTGLLKRGTYKPAAGWGMFLLRVLLACAVLAVYLAWLAQAFDWAALRSAPWTRLGALAGGVGGAVVLYVLSLLALGMRRRHVKSPIGG